MFLNMCVDSKVCAWVYWSLHVFKRQGVRAGLILEYLCVFEGERADGVCVCVCLRADGMADGSPYGYSFKASLSKGQQDFHYNRPLIFITLPSTNTHWELNTHSYSIHSGPYKGPVPQHTHTEAGTAVLHINIRPQCACVSRVFLLNQSSLSAVWSPQFNWVRVSFSSWWL